LSSREREQRGNSSLPLDRTTFLPKQQKNYFLISFASSLSFFFNFLGRFSNEFLSLHFSSLYHFLGSFYSAERLFLVISPLLLKVFTFSDFSFQLSARPAETSRRIIAAEIVHDCFYDKLLVLQPLLI